MKAFILSHFDAIITSLITIFGLFLTYRGTKRSFKDEIRKEKITRSSEAIQSLTLDFCMILDKMKDGEFSAQEYREMMSKVLAYGSNDAIKIVIKMQRLSYAMNNETQSVDTMELMATIALLITQLKYDLTSEIISPESWFLLRITDYETMRPKIVRHINSTIHELNLSLPLLV